MNIQFRRTMTQNLLIMESDESDDFESSTIKMITLNKIPGFLTPRIEELNGRIRMVFDIRDRYQIRNLFEMRKMTGKDLEFLMESVSGSVNALEEYLLDTRLIMLDPEYIFSDYEGTQYSFCLCPFLTADRQNGAEAFADMIISDIDYNDRDLVRMAYEINMAISSDTFHVRAFSSLKEKIRSEEPDAEVSRIFPEQPPLQPVQKVQEGMAYSRTRRKDPQEKKPEKPAPIRKLQDRIREMFFLA